MNHAEDAMSAYLARDEPAIVPIPEPIADPVERDERLIEWADDQHDYEDRGDDQQ